MDTIKRWRWGPGGLQWRIMVSYFLVTLVAALTIEVAVTVGSVVRGLPQQVEPIPQVLNQDEEQAAAQLAPSLKQTPIDQAALQRCLFATFLDNITTARPPEPPFSPILTPP